MFSKVAAFVRGEITSIETILAKWLQAVEQLEAHAFEQLKAAEKHAADALHLAQLASGAKVAEADAKAAASKAQDIAAKIKTIIA